MKAVGLLGLCHTSDILAPFDSLDIMQLGKSKELIHLPGSIS